MGITSRRHTQLHAQMQLTPVPPPGSAQWGFVGGKNKDSSGPSQKTIFAKIYSGTISGILNAYLPFDHGDYDLLHLF